jgi:hypothetical protein
LLDHVSGVLVVLVMRYRFISYRLVISHQMLAGLLKMNRRTRAYEDRFEPKFCLVYSLNQIALNVDKGKGVGHKYYIENYLKPFVNYIRKQIETSCRVQNI